MNPLSVLRLFAEQEFLVGLAAGAIGLAVTAVLRRWFESAAVWVVVTAASVGLLGLQPPDLDTPGWALPLLVVAAVAVAVNTSRASDVSGATMWLLFALTVFGVWGTVPDTEAAMVALGAAAAITPGAVLGGQRRWRALAGFAAALTVGGVALIDGLGRPSSLVGVTGAFGVLLLLGLGPRLRLSTSWPVVIPLHVALVIWSGRIAGTAETVPLASGLFAVGVGAAIPLWWLLTRLEARSGRASKPDRTAGEGPAAT